MTHKNLNLMQAYKNIQEGFFAGYTLNIEQKLSNAIQFTAERSGSCRMYWLMKCYTGISYEVQTCEYENSKTIHIIL
jgi:hypothetical protein